MSSTAGRSHMPLKSGFPFGKRGIDPAGAEAVRCATPDPGAKNSTDVNAAVAMIRLEV